MTAIHTYSFPTPIHFGPGARALLRDHLATQGVRRPLVVTDRGVAALPLFRDVMDRLTGLETAAFSDVWGNPTESQVLAGVEAFRAHRADAIVGLGGGAALDVAKAVALLVNHPGALFDYEDEKPGARAIDREVPYWVALPTTAGTGSEVGRSAVIADDRTHVKRILFSPRLLARAVFADPELTLDLPAKVTAATGMDALTHCVEAYLAKNPHPICDGIALEGLRIAARNLARCVHTPRDLEARSGMLMASMMGAIAFQKGLGVVHSCAHALSAEADLHHGLANGIMIDHALRHNVPAVPERFAALAAAVGLKESSGDAFLAWLRDLKREVGIPAKLGDANVRPDQLERLATLAEQDSCHQNNPRPCTREDFRRLFAEAL